MKKKLPDYIFGSTLLVIFLSFLIFYLIDLRNIFGLRDFLFSLDRRYFFFGYRPFFFHHWGRNSGFAEIFQFIFLGLSSLISAFCAGKYSGKKISKFWTIMSFAFLFMLIEDAGNIRHVLLSYVMALFDEIDQGLMGTLFELAYFSVLGLIPLSAIIFYWKEVKKFLKVKIYLLIGFISYAIAGSLSFLGSAFEGILENNFYTRLGEQIYQLSLFLGDSALAEKWESFDGGSFFTIEFFLVDSLIEENIELLGSGAFLASVVAFLLISKKHD